MAEAITPTTSKDKTSCHSDGLRMELAYGCIIIQYNHRDNQRDATTATRWRKPPPLRAIVGAQADRA
jgi:hypothetical protein